MTILFNTMIIFRQVSSPMIMHSVICGCMPFSASITSGIILVIYASPMIVRMRLTWPMIIRMRLAWPAPSTNVN
uniref:Putative secreted protein n=1 Tax=Anopheles darlingi TaxID=43151 RepID=A0A2M4DJE8_ANODA